MAKRYEVAFDILLDEDTADHDAAIIIDDMLSGLDHTTVFVRAADEIDGSVVGDWASSDDEDTEDTEEG